MVSGFAVCIPYGTSFKFKVFKNSALQNTCKVKKPCWNSELSNNPFFGFDFHNLSSSKNCFIFFSSQRLMKLFFTYSAKKT